MKVYKTSALVLLLVICITAIALGYAGSKSIPEEKTATLTVNANSTGIFIPRHLINSEVRNVLSEISRQYPNSVLFSDEEVTLIGSKTVDTFKQSLSENNIDFDWTAVGTFYALEPAVVTNGPYIIYSPSGDSVNIIGSVNSGSMVNSVNSGNSITISYDELKKILDGNNETVSYYRELLNNSKYENNSTYGFHTEGNISTASVVIIDKVDPNISTSPAQWKAMTISSSGNNSE